MSCLVLFVFSCHEIAGHRCYNFKIRYTTDPQLMLKQMLKKAMVQAAVSREPGHGLGKGTAHPAVPEMKEYPKDDTREQSKHPSGY